MRPIRFVGLTVFVALAATAVAGSAVGAVARQSEFGSVSCTSMRSCMAVGFFLSSGGEHTLAERFNGRSWSIEATVSPGIAPALFGVSCASTRFCMAVGSGSEGTIAERWNGFRWILSASRNPSGATSALGAVSCPRVGWCIAAGDSDNDRSPLVELYSGGAWTVQPLTAPDGTSFIDLDAISCSSEATCLAVGSADVRGHYVPVAERFANGAWANVPVEARGPQPTLTAVSCVASGYCLAVGDATPQGTPEGPIAVAFKSASSTVLSPAGGSRAGLYGVDCLAAGRCVTVGATSRGNVEYAYSEALSGTRWNSLEVANPGVPDALTGGAWCSSTRSCVAAGYYAGQGAQTAPLSEVLSGKHWRSIPGTAKQL
jgi:hypothetical protein